MTLFSRFVTSVLNKFIMLLVVGLMFIVSTQVVLAHGVDLEYYQRDAIEIIASYSTGEPLAEGQVTVFAPDNLTEPWLTGICDESGSFTFIPDSGIPGLWEVQVRQAGHGGMIRVEIGEDVDYVPDSRGFSLAQKILMVAAVSWGLIGTALFFSRRDR